MAGPGEFLRPLFGRGSQVWERKERGARNREARHAWRPGPDAPGVCSQRASDLGATPPGNRKVGLRDVIGTGCRRGD